MNRCSFSEEETTKALTSRYQVPAPAPEGQIMQGHPTGNLLGVSDARHFDQNAQDLGLHGCEKKKQGLKDVSEITHLDGPRQISGSMKKNLPLSIKSKSLNGVNQSPAVNDVDFQHSGQSSSLVSEKRRHKQKDKSKLLESYSGGGIVYGILEVLTNNPQLEIDFFLSKFFIWKYLTFFYLFHRNR